jgi:hypothetical protein
MTDDILLKPMTDDHDIFIYFCSFILDFNPDFEIQM